MLRSFKRKGGKMKRKQKSQNKVIAQVSKETGLSRALLHFAFQFGIMGIIHKKKKAKAKP